LLYLFIIHEAFIDDIGVFLDVTVFFIPVSIPHKMLNLRFVLLILTENMHNFL